MKRIQNILGTCVSINCFEVQAEKTPNDLAVEFENQTISYTDLNVRANQLAHYLQSIGVRPGVFIGIFMQRSLDIHVALLATLKAGGAYVPLDPSFPSERLAFMVENSGLNIILTQHSLIGSLPSDKPTVVCIDFDSEKISRASTVAPTTVLTSQHLAYVIYTSGSTGVPKGVEIFHGAVVNFLRSIAKEPGLTAGDTLLSVTTLSFDISVLEIFLPLTVGAKVLLVSQEVAADGVQLHQAMTQGSPTVMQATPATWRMLIAAGWEGNPNLRIFCGGEALSSELAEELLSRGQEVWNLYGPTETTIWSARWRVESRDKILIGRPIANTEIYLLDKHLRPVPIGVAGELHIGGSGLARGYLKRQELTEAKFIAHPFSNDPRDRLYKTGDLARYLPDGNIECLGRLDFQVKVRGFRIELGEIEAALCQVPAVREAVVIACADAHKENRLVAYFVANDEQTVTVSEFREQLQATLPHYMIPTAFVPLDTIPLTPNGKVDRKALPEPDAGVQLVEEFSAPQNATEEALVRIWEEVLQIDQVSIDDNFFELGGHSLLATRLAQIIQSELSVDIAAKSIFEQQTIRELASSLEPAEHNQLPEIIRLPEDQPKRLSFAQQALWMMHKLHPNSPHYNIPTAFKIVGDLNTKAICQALNAIVERHEILRTNYQLDSNDDGVPIVQPMQEFSLSTKDLSLLDEATQALEVTRLMDEEAQKPFNLTSDIMLRASLLKLSIQTHILLVTTHHIASDGWSLGILNRELSELYSAYAKGSERSLPTLEFRYSDFANWEQDLVKNDILENLLTYWKEQLKSLPLVHNFPLDRPRPAKSSYLGGNVFHNFSVELLNDLNRFAQAQGVTLFMVLNAAFSILLSRHSGEKDIVVGTPVANRNYAELESLFGCFVNPLVIRMDLSDDPTFNDFLSQSKERLLAAYEHQQLPIELLVGELQPERSLGYNPLFQILLVMQHNQEIMPSFSGLTVSPMNQTSHTAKFDLTLDVSESKNGLAMRWEYATDLFDVSTIDKLITHFEVLLNGIVANPDCRLSTLPLLAKTEYDQIVKEWNNTAKDYPKDACLHTLFERQVDRTPDNIAVACGHKKLSYEELNQRANQVAHYLVEQGVKPETLVGICLQRSIDMVVGLLGILKAGCAYVPLDPAYPPKRLEYILKDSDAKMVISQSELVNYLPEPHVRRILLDDEGQKQELAKYSHQNLAYESIGLTPSNLAYIIYTSGSTGNPKGVMIEHRSTVALIDWSRSIFKAEEMAKVLFSTSICFDLSVYELFVPLGLGGSVLIVDNILALQQSGFSGQPSLVNTVPSAIKELIEANSIPLSVKTVNLAGERLDQSVVEDLYQMGIERVFDLYGPSEDTTYSTYALRIINGDYTIGKPISNTQAYVLDNRLQPVPIGAPGELFLGGAGLARGYLNRPQLTEEKFLPNPFSANQTDRMYKTGDLVRWRPNGNLEYIGRADNQVKIRGFRIELGEIESLLSSYNGVQTAVVIAKEQKGVYQLVAYYTKMENAVVSEIELKNHLATNLPEHMIPAGFISLESIPMTPNGKIDRKALQKRTVELTSSQEYEPPRTALERELSGIWEELLEVDRVGRLDSFFELGGHSLLSIRLLSQIKKKLGRELPMTALYEMPTIERLANIIQDGEFSKNSSLLVPIQTNGSKLPFFFTGLNGGFLPRNLSSCMGNSQPFYALLTESLEGKEISHSIVVEMATRLISEIRTVQPEGPYLLGGFCAQAIVTFEMAHQFHTQSQKVEVILFEEIAPGKRKLSYTLQRRMYRDMQRIKSHMGNLIRMESSGKLNYLKEGSQNFFSRIAKKIRRKLATQNYESVHKITALQVSHEDRERALRTKLWESYEPKVYPGSITLFVGSDVKYSHDPELGWGELIANGVDVQVVPGNHTDMLREPHVQILAEKLTACLAKAGANHKEKKVLV